MAGTVSSSSMSVSGLSSGIDTKALIEQLIYLDRAPARIAESNKAKTQANLDAVKAMNTRLLAISTALDDVKTGAGFDGRTVSSSSESVLTATASASAIPGSMTVSVKGLAAAHQVASDGQTSASDDLGAGSLTFRLASMAAEDPDIVITPTTNTLSGLAGAINAANKGIVASVVNDGSGSPYRLLITAAKTGEANAISSMQGSGGFAAVVPDLSLLTQVTAAADAQVRIGDPDTGMLVKSASNTMDQAIPGVTLQLKAKGDSINVTVAQDADKAMSTAQALVDAVNTARSFFTSNSRYDSVSKTAGALFGEYDVGLKLQDIGDQLIRSFSGQPDGFKNLAEVGIAYDDDGALAIDEDLFATKMSENPSAVRSLFTAVGAAAYTPLNSLTQSTNGVMALKQTTLESSLQVLTDRITAIDARLEQRQKFYQAKFLAMEKITAQMQSQGSSITSFVNGLSKSSS